MKETKKSTTVSPLPPPVIVVSSKIELSKQTMNIEANFRW